MSQIVHWIKLVLEIEIFKKTYYYIFFYFLSYTKAPSSLLPIIIPVEAKPDR